MPLQRITIGPDDRHWHKAFFHYIEEVFPGIDFRAWTDHGGWTSGYRAYALVQDQRIVANVSVASAELVIGQAPRKGLQLGAVGAIPAWRGQGLVRELTVEVLNQLRNETDVVFLFAHGGVHNLYPRFGFVHAPEYVFGVDGVVQPSHPRLGRLSFTLAKDRQQLARLCKTALPVTARFGLRHDYHTLLWYGDNFHADDFYYSAEHDAVIVAQTEGTVLTVLDVVANHQFDLAELLPSLIESPVEHLEFGFTPELWWPAAKPLRTVDDSWLFIEPTTVLPTEPFRFPVLGHT